MHVQATLIKLKRIRKRNKKKKGMTLGRKHVGKRSFRGNGKKINEGNEMNIMKIHYIHV